MADRIEDVPNQPKTPARSVRLSDEVWDALKAEADRNGEKVSDVIRRAVEEHLQRQRD